MKITNKLLRMSTIALVALFAVSCADLAVENTNEPATEQVIVTASDVAGLVQGAYATWALYSQAYQTAPLLVQADWYTGTVGNWWVNLAGNEVGDLDAIQNGTRKRTEAFPNTPTTSYGPVVNFHWTYYYSALYNVNTALAIIKAGEINLGTEAEVQQLKATAKLLQGILHGSVGLIFDQGYIVDENTDVSTLALSPYKDVVAAGITYLEEAITTATAAAAAGSPGVSTSIIPEIGSVDSRFAGAGTIDWVEFKEIANTYAASFSAQYARTATESNDIDWTKVYNYASKGLSFDFAPHSDDNNWIPYLYYYGNNDWWRPDMRIVNKLDPNQPKYWPTTDGQNGQGPDAPSVNSPDQRFGPGKDYEESYAWSVFNPTRGYFKKTHVVYSRYNYFVGGIVWSDPIPYMLRAQNNLLIAEAELNRTGGSLANAVAMINDTRVGRGGLAALTILDSPAKIREALEYEWDIEVAVTGVSNLSPWYNSRRWGNMLSGSMLHLPVPAGELGLSGIDYYTFGGGGEGSAPKIIGGSGIDTKNRNAININR
ncbi:MAG: hypothetical protein WC967_09065 [Balneolaceae bacterium]